MPNWLALVLAFCALGVVFPPLSARRSNETSRLSDWSDWGIFSFGLMMALIAISGFLLPLFAK
jgi:hypothetical protein